MDATRFFIVRSLPLHNFFPRLLLIVFALYSYSYSLCDSGDKRRKLEEEKGIVIRFVIGHRLKTCLDIL